MQLAGPACLIDGQLAIILQAAAAFPCSPGWKLIGGNGPRIAGLA
jgi:hypothetical protein